MKITIEKAREADRPRMFELLEQANMHHIPSREMEEITFENYVVAKMGGEVVGLSGYKILSATEAKTELMVVDSKCRGLGVGHLLQVRRMQDMLARGTRMLTTNATFRRRSPGTRNTSGTAKSERSQKNTSSATRISIIGQRYKLI